MYVYAPGSIGPATRSDAATPATSTGTVRSTVRVERSGRVDRAGQNSSENLRAIASDDQKWEAFAFALTGRSASQRTPAENRALKTLRREILDGKIAPEIVVADPANGSGPDRLPSRVRGAYVSGGNGAQGRVLISGQLRGAQLQKTTDEEMGEAVADRAAQLGIGVADGDAGARIRIVMGGGRVTLADNPTLFANQATDETTVVSNGQVVTAQADATGAVYADSGRTGADGVTYYLGSPAGLQLYLQSFDTDGNGLDRHELKLALGGDAVSDDKIDRFMRFYGVYDEATGDYLIPTSGSTSLDATEPGYENTGVKQMVADGAVFDAGFGEIGSVLGRVSNATLAHAMIRHAATEKHKKDKAAGGTTSLQDTIRWYQDNGMDAIELDLATDYILGDSEPLNSTNGHRDVIVANFRTRPGENKINAAGLTEAFDLGALQRKPSDNPDDTFIGFTAHNGPVSRTNPGDHLGSHDESATENYVFPALSFSDLMLPGALAETPDDTTGVYQPPNIRFSSTIVVGWDRDKRHVDGANFTRREELDENGQPTGNVIWEIAGTRQTSYRSRPVTLTVAAGSRKDRYLQDFHDFSVGDNANKWNANLVVAQEMQTPGGDTVQVWVPKEHQFSTNPDGTAAQTYDKPVVTVNGQVVEVVAVDPVLLPNGETAYVLTTVSPDGSLGSVTYIPKNNREATAFARLDARFNGQSAATSPQGIGSASDVARAISYLPPEEAGRILDVMGHHDASAVLAVMLPSVAAQALATMPPAEAAEIIVVLMGTSNGVEIAASILARMPPGNAGLILAELDSLPIGHGGQGGRGLQGDQQETRSQRLLAPIARYSTPQRAVQVAQVVSVASSGGAANPEESGAYMQGALNEIYGPDVPPAASTSLTGSALAFLLNFVMPQDVSPEQARNLQAARLMAMPRNQAAAELVALFATDPDRAVGLLVFIAETNPEAAMEILMQMAPDDGAKFLNSLPPRTRAKIHAAWQAAGTPTLKDGPPQAETDLQIADRMIADGNPALSATELGTIAKTNPAKAAGILAIIAKENPYAAAEILGDMPADVAARVMIELPPDQAAEILARMDPSKAIEILDVIAAGETEGDNAFGTSQGLANNVPDGFLAELVAALLNDPHGSFETNADVIAGVALVTGVVRVEDMPDVSAENIKTAVATVDTEEEVVDIFGPGENLADKSRIELVLRLLLAPSNMAASGIMDNVSDVDVPVVLRAFITAPVLEDGTDAAVNEAARNGRAADLIMELPEAQQAAILGDIFDADFERVVGIVAAMPPERAARALLELEPLKAAVILNALALHDPALAVTILMHIQNTDPDVLNAIAPFLAVGENGQFLGAPGPVQSIPGSVSEISAAPPVTEIDVVIADAEDVQATLDNRIGGTSRHSDKTGNQVIAEASEAGWMVNVNPDLTFDEAVEQGWVIPIADASKAEQAQFIKMVSEGDVKLASDVIPKQSQFRRAGLKGGAPFRSGGPSGARSGPSFIRIPVSTTRFTDRRKIFTVTTEGNKNTYSLNTIEPETVSLSNDPDKPLLLSIKGDEGTLQVAVNVEELGAELSTGIRAAMLQLALVAGDTAANPDFQIVFQGQAAYAKIHGKLFMLYDGTNIGLGFKAAISAGILKGELTFEKNFTFTDPSRPWAAPVTVSIRGNKSLSIGAGASAQAYVLYNVETKRWHIVLGGELAFAGFDLDISFGPEYPDDERLI